MRPRHKAAENRLRLRQPRDLVVASMRPRHKAAENDEAAFCDDLDEVLLQ